MNKLKPCRFCGGEVQAIKSDNPHLHRPIRNGWHIQCNACALLYGYDTDYAGVYGSEEEAIAAWNRRPEPHKYTLDELNGLVGQPIWLETGWISINEQIIGEYEILRSITDEGFWFTRNVKGFKASDYGITWVAYDRPPEEE